MKKIAVMSDNHGDPDAMDFIRELEPDADFYVHCGDSEASDIHVLDGYIAVAGNNDWYLKLPKYAKFKCEDIWVLVTHGQFYGYFDREKKMAGDLKHQKCQLLLSGHTHMPNVSMYKNLTFVNPGSTSWPRGGSKRSYAVITVDGTNIEAEIKSLEDDD